MECRIWGQKPKSWRLKVTSALVRTADIVRSIGKREECLYHRAFEFRSCKACRWNPFADLPDGQISELPVQPPLQKYSASRLPQITFTTRAVPSPRRGVGHRHERWGGMRWTRQRRAREGIAGRVLMNL